MDNSVVCSLAQRLRALGYDIKGTEYVPRNGVPEKNLVYVNGHHPQLSLYGEVRLIEGTWKNPETEITILPPEVYFG